MLQLALCKIHDFIPKTLLLSWDDHLIKKYNLGNRTSVKVILIIVFQCISCSLLYPLDKGPATNNNRGVSQQTRVVCDNLDGHLNHDVCGLKPTSCMTIARRVRWGSSWHWAVQGNWLMLAGFRDICGFFNLSQLGFNWEQWDLTNPDSCIFLHFFSLP